MLERLFWVSSRTQLAAEATSPSVRRVDEINPSNAFPNASTKSPGQSPPRRVADVSAFQRSSQAQIHRRLPRNAGRWTGDRGIDRRARMDSRAQPGACVRHFRAKNRFRPAHNHRPSDLPGSVISVHDEFRVCLSHSAFRFQISAFSPTLPFVSARRCDLHPRQTSDCVPTAGADPGRRY